MDQCGRQTRLVVIKQICYVVEPKEFTIYKSTLSVILICEAIYKVPIKDPEDYTSAILICYVTKPYAWIIARKDFREAMREQTFQKCIAKIWRSSAFVEEAILIKPGRKRNESQT